MKAHDDNTENIDVTDFHTDQVETSLDSSDSAPDNQKTAITGEPALTRDSINQLETGVTGESIKQLGTGVTGESIKPLETEFGPTGSGDYTVAEAATKIDETLENYELSNLTSSLKYKLRNLSRDSYQPDAELDMERRLKCYLKNILFHIGDPWYEKPDPEELEAYKTLQDVVTSELISELFDVTPFFGVLEPFEVQTIRIAFHPMSCLTTSGLLQCFIRGGPVENLRVIGVVSDIRFSLDETFIDFGRQVSFFKDL